MHPWLYYPHVDINQPFLMDLPSKYAINIELILVLAPTVSLCIQIPGEFGYALGKNYNLLVKTIQKLANRHD